MTEIFLFTIYRLHLVLGMQCNYWGMNCIKKFMIQHFDRQTMPYRVILRCKNENRKFTYYSYDTEWLEYDDSRYDVEITKSKYELQTLPEQRSIFNR